MKRSRQNWKRLFRQPRFELHFGQNYHTGQASIAQTVRNAATRHGVKVSVIDHGTYVAVFVRGPTEPPEERLVPTAAARNSGVREIGDPDTLPPVRARD